MGEPRDPHDTIQVLHGDVAVELDGQALLESAELIYRTICHSPVDVVLAFAGLGDDGWSWHVFFDRGQAFFCRRRVIQIHPDRSYVGDKIFAAFWREIYLDKNSGPFFAELCQFFLVLLECPDQHLGQWIIFFIFYFVFVVSERLKNKVVTAQGIQECRCLS